MIAILSQKEGVGKTTIALNLSVAASLNKKKSVIIDTAPHTEQSALSTVRQDNLVIIPCRPSIINICKIAEVKYFIVLNQVLSRSKLTQDTLNALKELQIPTIPISIG